MDKAAYIRTTAERYRKRFEYSRTITDATKELLNNAERAFLGERQFDDLLLNQLKIDQSYEGRAFVQEVLSSHHITFDNQEMWSIDHPIIRRLVHVNNCNLSQQSDGLFQPVARYIANQLSYNLRLDTKKFIEFLISQGFSDAYIITLTIYFANPFQYVSHNYRYIHLPVTEEKKTSPFAEYILPLLRPTKGFLGMAKKDGLKKLVDKAVFEQYNIETISNWLSILYTHYPESLEGNYEKFLTHKDRNGQKILLLNSILFLIHTDAKRFESIVVSAIEKGVLAPGERFSLLLLLNQKLPGKFHDQIIATGENHFDYYKGINQSGSYFHEPMTFEGTLSEAYTSYLFSRNEAEATLRVERFFKEATFLNYNFFRYVVARFGEKATPMLVEALAKDPKNIVSYNSSYHYDALFDLLEKKDLTPYFDEMMDFAIRRAGKTTRASIAKLIARDQERAIIKAQELLEGRTTDLRVIGAIILSFIKSERVAAILNDAVDRETNDDTRDIMLETLQDVRFASPYSIAQVNDMIGKATARRKLTKWTEKWLSEEELPKLYWSDGRRPFTSEEVRFLFYRMKRAQGLNSDIEARQVLQHIDKESSQKFPQALLVAFENSNADTRIKYYLTIAGLLGNDDMMHRLNILFKKNLADKRIKMAENVVGALAMIGTDKALRMVEVIYRKLATKRPSISSTAREALDAAASELGIGRDELSDRIVPNFDFEGIYKNFTIEEDSYRAFVNTDFKLSYFTEDNKLRKSLPANASKELKAEFKEIEKEINGIVKSQSIRLEKYMIEERRWSSEHWRSFFFENPVLFVYALKLVWGVYDTDGKLLNEFYCSEDTSLYDLSDEELVLEDDQYIGILHPIHLTEENIQAWKEKLNQLKITTIFPILERSLFRVEEGEKELIACKRFHGEAVPKGADFVNSFLVKQQWMKSTGDGGSSEFYKLFKDGQIKAVPYIEGPAAYYQGGDTPAKVFDINFNGKNWNDKIILKDIPPVFFSEVLSDIHQLIKSS